MLENREGQRVPVVTFKTRQTVNGNEDWADVTTEQLFADKTVILFSLPGAFTPTCSSTHLPRYNELASTFKKEGVDEIVCISVNDTFVMNAWKADQESENITVIPDGNGEFTAGMDMLVDKDDLGFGKRSWRYAMLVKDGVIEKMFIEPQKPGDPFEVSDADTMLNYINPQIKSPESVAIFTKPGCPYCSKAKRQLAEHGYQYEEIILGKDATVAGMRAVTGAKTVPQIYMGGKHIGDSEALESYLNNN